MEPPNKRTKSARTSVELGHKRINPSTRTPLFDVTNGKHTYCVISAII